VLAGELSTSVDKETLKMRKLVQLTLVLMVACPLLVQGGCYKEPKDSAARDKSTLQVGPAVPAGLAAYERAVSESARDIPVAYDVDVVVVGGTSGGVAAAVKAAEEGAKVFLAASRPYLGEDMCGTYRLWLQPGEEPTSPLAKKLFAEPSAGGLLKNGIPFNYEADKASAGVHKDTQPPSVLADGKWHSAASQSVQYDGDVTITAELAEAHRLEKVHVMVYQRDNDFEVESVTVYVGDDGENWKQVAVIKNEKLGQGSFEDSAIGLSGAVGEAARYVKFSVSKSPRVNRILLGEISVEPKQSGKTSSSSEYRIPPTPMQVKRTLDGALLESGVEFLFGCYGTDVLRDRNGKVAGIVMANRSGRQAVKAKVVIDATARAGIARLAGGAFRAYPGGLQGFKRIVVGGGVREGKHAEAQKMPTPILTGDGRRHEAVEFMLEIPMKDGSFASFAEAEQVARDKTWHREQGDASEALFQVPPDAMKGKKRLSGRWPGAEEVHLDVFRPAGVEGVFVLGGCADVSRIAAVKLLRPLEYMTVGGRIGAAAAAEARATARLRDVRLRGEPAKAVASGDIREDLAWVRAAQAKRVSVRADKRAVPVVGEYDVVVVGGGTGGAPAGIAAARQGAKTLVVEYLNGLGGVGTLGLIGKYYHGYREGFTREIDEGLAGLGGSEEAGSNRGQAWNIELKMEWYRRELRKAGADIWFGVLGCGAFVENARVKGVVVVTPECRGVVLSEVVIDSTGNADIASAAGAACVYTDGTGVAVQGAGLPPREIGGRYTNTDWTFIDDGDVLDVWRAFVVAKEKFKGAYDLGQLIDTRERRRIVGDFVMSPLDICNNRTYRDTVVLGKSDFDTHGFTVHPVFMLVPPGRQGLIANVPYRCLVPKGLDGILVTGLAISAHRDAVPILRMQADIQNEGYAAGVAAAMAAKAGGGVRDVDIKALQRHLIKKGSLPERVLTDKDSFGVAEGDLVQAVKRVSNDFEGLDIVLAQPERALPLLREAYKSADSPKAKLAYAHILGMLGEAIGADTLADAVASRQWDKGWNYTGMGQYGASLSDVDSLIIALGRTRDKRALGVIVEKVKDLDAGSEFSHCRAVAMGLESLGDPGGAKALLELLKKPGMTGHAFTDIKEAMRRTPANSSDTKTRNYSLRELVLARALYRCGDYEGLGEEILEDYARDLRAHYRRHAQAVLNEKGRGAKSGAE